MRCRINLTKSKINKIMKKIKIVSISFELTDILTAKDDDVLLRATGYGIDYESVDCIAVVSRPLFHKLTDEFLDNKKKYWEFTKEFCGVGYIMSDKFEKIKGKYNLRVEENIDDNYTSVYINVKSYRILEGEVDMEHG